MADWRWDESARRYRRPDGRFLSPTTEAGLREQVIAEQRATMQAAAERMGAGDMSVQDFRAEMRELIARTNGVEYMFGRGGRNAMTADDRAALRGLIADEWRYLDEFARAAGNGELSAAQITARAAMYANAGHRAQQAGRGATYAGLRLPTYPGVDTECRSNCRCSWRVEEDDAEWRAYWTLAAAEHCDTCVGRAARYAPYAQAKRGGLRVVA